ncbi:MAG: class I SAM-dependent methyltransferase [Planctomycetota bacterium]|nr:class I SAM-dependent methyltransferase [Planctomycetota bacterium]
MTIQVSHESITMRDGFDARLLLSYGRLSRSVPRSVQVVEVGCSTGVDLIHQASLQPEVLFTGVDGSEAAIKEARAAAAEKGLGNIEFQVADLSNLEGLEVPELGYDAAYISGLPTCAQGGLAGFLENVASTLAPHGLISVTLPGRRQHFSKVIAAIEGSAKRSAPLRERLEAARDQIDRLVQDDPSCPDWRRAALVDDAEFVDRYMGNTSAHLDVAEVFRALESASLGFIRWHDASAWNFESLGLDREELERVRSLPMAEQFRVVEEHLSPETLSFVIGKAENGPRERFDLTKAGETHFMVHPEATFTIDCRNYWGSTHYEGLKVRRGNEEPVAVRPSPALTALFALRDQREPFSGLNLVETMTAGGAELEEALMALHQLVGLELIYRPHEFDVAQFYSSLLRARASAAASEHLDEGVIVTPSVKRELDEIPQPLPATPAAEESPSRMIDEPLEATSDTKSGGTYES